MFKSFFTFKDKLPTMACSRSVLGWYPNLSVVVAMLPIMVRSNVMLKVPSCKLYNNTYMTALKQITKTEIFAFIAILVFKLLSCKVLLLNRKDNRNC